MIAHDSTNNIKWNEFVQHQFPVFLDLPSNATSKILSNRLTIRKRDTLRKTEVVVRLTNYDLKRRTFSKKDLKFIEQVENINAFKKQWKRNKKIN